MDWNQLTKPLVETFLFSILGLLFFGVAFWFMNKASPFSIRKELEEDQNVALAIVMASVILGIAIIVAAALSS